MWAQLDTDWVCLDAELMPWSAKAQELLRSQYAAVGSSASAALAEVVSSLEVGSARGAGTEELLRSFSSRREMVHDFVSAYRRYCWNVECIEDFKVAPFHLLATEGAVHTDKDHVWHMETLAGLCRGSDVLTPTSFRVVDVTSETAIADGVAWWEQLTGNGGEGMVVKPRTWIARSKRGLVQPAVKCRGREYLRIIYGPSTAHRRTSSACAREGSA